MKKLILIISVIIMGIAIRAENPPVLIVTIDLHNPNIKQDALKKHPGDRDLGYTKYLGLDSIPGNLVSRPDTPVLPENFSGKNQESPAITAYVMNVMSGFRTGLSIWDSASDKTKIDPGAEFDNNMKMRLSIGTTNDGAGLKFKF